jgi:hypothetical protein
MGLKIFSFNNSILQERGWHRVIRFSHSAWTAGRQKKWNCLWALVPHTKWHPGMRLLLDGNCIQAVYPQVGQETGK